MLGLTAAGNRVLVSKSTNPLRKLGFSWEAVEASFDGASQLVGINTSRPNALVAEALAEKRLAPFAGYERIRPERKYGKSSRVDFFLEADGRPPCYLEVKNCHYMRRPGLAEFPDCVAARSAKHLGELADMVAGGARAVLVYVIQMDAERFAAGVESYAYMCRVTPEEIAIEREVAITHPSFRGSPNGSGLRPAR
jgi:sugar fermentation stimulation protein A